MNELMIHVERIVRPVSATQGRKLRMRADLLAHLQQTLEEERPHFPGDERGAMERSKLRLGEPNELTEQLQQTVPLVERTLLRRIPTSPYLGQLEGKMACVPGQRGTLTLGHKSVLSAMASLAFAQLVISLLSALASAEMRIAHYVLSAIGIPLGWFVLLFVSYRFVFETASGSQRIEWLGTLKRGAIVFAAQTALTFFVFFSIADRFPTVHEATICGTGTIVTLVFSGLGAYRIGLLRRPYDEWLSLNIAE